MATIIEHGDKYLKYKTKCPHCNYVFKYDLIDVDSSKCTSLTWITCPECNESLTHYETDIIINENTTH